MTIISNSLDVCNSKKRMKIVHVISSLRRGGRERQLATIYRFSDVNKFTTKIVVFNQTIDTYVNEYQMCRDVIYCISKNPIKRYLEMRRIITEYKADIVWTWGGLEATYGMLFSLTSKVRHINGSIRHGLVRFNVHQLWRLFVLHLSKNIVANSQSGLRANKLKRGYVLYNGIDAVFFFKPDSFHINIRKELEISDNEVVLVSVANLVPYKDYATVLRSLSVIKQKGIPFHYIAIGEGSERRGIEGIVDELNLLKEVSFIGRRSDVKEILYSSDIFIHSSLGEGCSNAILEAMAAGLPIIASNTGGTSEVVDNSIGRLFEYKDVDSLVLHISEVISDITLRKEMAKNSRLRAENLFSIETMITNYHSIVEECIK